MTPALGGSCLYKINSFNKNNNKEKKMIIKTEREKITEKNKTKNMKKYEELLKEYDLKFEYKTSYFKVYDDGSKYYSKTYYEISILNDDKTKTEKIKFFYKRGHQEFSTYLYKAFRTGGDEE